MSVVSTILQKAKDGLLKNPQKAELNGSVVSAFPKLDLYNPHSQDLDGVRELSSQIAKFFKEPYRYFSADDRSNSHLEDVIRRISVRVDYREQALEIGKAALSYFDELRSGEDHKINVYQLRTKSEYNKFSTALVALRGLVGSDRYHDGKKVFRSLSNMKPGRRFDSAIKYQVEAHSPYDLIELASTGFHKISLGQIASSNDLSLKDAYDLNTKALIEELSEKFHGVHLKRWLELSHGVSPRKALEIEAAHNRITELASISSKVQLGKIIPNGEIFAADVLRVFSHILDLSTDTRAIKDRGLEIDESDSKLLKNLASNIVSLVSIYFDEAYEAHCRQDGMIGLPPSKLPSLVRTSANFPFAHQAFIALARVVSLDMNDGNSRKFLKKLSVTTDDGADITGLEIAKRLKETSKICPVAKYITAQLRILADLAHARPEVRKTDQKRQRDRKKVLTSPNNNESAKQKRRIQSKLTLQAEIDRIKV